MFGLCWNVFLGPYSSTCLTMWGLWFWHLDFAPLEVKSNQIARKNVSQVSFCKITDRLKLDFSACKIFLFMLHFLFIRRSKILWPTTSLFLPQKRLEMSAGLLKNHWVFTPPKGLEVSPGVLKNIHWWDLNFSWLFCCCVPPSSHLLLWQVANKNNV